MRREAWGTRIGMILAAAGSAVGIGNLLRFPGQAASNGGGAFMIPYVVSLLLFGLPVMWMAWTIGRYGGQHGHGTTPGMFDVMVRHPAAKYFGVIGVALPLIFVLYYTYIEAWCLAYAWFSLTGAYEASHVDLAVFFGEFLGDAPTSNYFGGLTTALVFLGITLGLNAFVLYRGVTRGIELLARIAIPLLILFCIVLGVWVLSLGPEAWSGLEYLWTPDLGALTNPAIWMAAAGQVFFTLTIGYGALECFASYLGPEDDVVLSGLSASSLNEFVEVIFGSMIAIPAAAFYFGIERVPEIADAGTFAIGMISMPEVFRGMGGSALFGSIWFLLLFFAAFTSSVAVAQPVMAFFQDELKLTRGRATVALFTLWLVGSFPVVFFYRYGTLDEMDFWAGTIGLVVFSTIEALLFGWIFGIRRGWEEMSRGAQLSLPRVFAFVMKWVTPVLLVAILGAWLYDAVVHEKLTPRPTVKLGFDELGERRGRFLLVPPGEESTQGRERARLEAALAEAVAEAGSDLRARFSLTVNPLAPTRVVASEADEALMDALGEERLERYVTIMNPRYKRASGETRRPEEVVLVLEVRDRAGMIWLVRGLIVAVNGLFLYLIWSTWRRRSRQAGAEVSS